MPRYTMGNPEDAQGGSGRRILHVPNGFYRVLIENCVEGFSSNGNEMFTLSCRIQTERGEDGPQCKEFLVFTDKASWKVDQVWMAIGRKLVPGQAIDVQPKHFYGATAVCAIGSEPGRNPGTLFNLIERWISPEEAAKIQLGPYPSADQIGNGRGGSRPPAPRQQASRPPAPRGAQPDESFKTPGFSRPARKEEPDLSYNEEDDIPF